MPGADSTVYRGFYDTPHIQDRLRLYGQEEKIFQLIALRQVNPLSILTIISEKFGVVSADMLTDWRFRYQEFDELPYSFTLAAASATPVSGTLIDYVKLTNSDAASLNTNHRLMLSGNYTGIDMSGGGTTTNTGDEFDVTNHPLHEICRITGIGSASSAFEGNTADSGFTWIKLARIHPSPDMTGQLLDINTASELKLVNSIAKTNQRPNPPVTANG